MSLPPVAQSFPCDTQFVCSAGMACTIENPCPVHCVVNPEEVLSPLFTQESCISEVLRFFALLLEQRGHTEMALICIEVSEGNNDGARERLRLHLERSVFDDEMTLFLEQWLSNFMVDDFFSAFGACYPDPSESKWKIPPDHREKIVNASNSYYVAVYTWNSHKEMRNRLFLQSIRDMGDPLTSSLLLPLLRPGHFNPLHAKFRPHPVTKVPVLTVIGVDGLQTDRSLGMLLPQLNGVISETSSAW